MSYQQSPGGSPWNQPPNPYGSQAPSNMASQPPYGAAPAPYGATPPAASQPYGSASHPYGSPSQPYGSPSQPYGAAPAPYGAPAPTPGYPPAPGYAPGYAPGGMMQPMYGAPNQKNGAAMTGFIISLGALLLFIAAVVLAGSSDSDSSLNIAGGMYLGGLGLWLVSLIVSGVGLRRTPRWAAIIGLVISLLGLIVGGYFLLA